MNTQKRKVVEGDLVLTEDFVYDGNLEVHGNITGKRKKLFNISAWNISATGNISAWNISAKGNISAENITYYAVCFAYRNIRCRTIKGQRANAKHFVLDGTIVEEIE